MGCNDGWVEERGEEKRIKWGGKDAGREGEKGEKGWAVERGKKGGGWFGGGGRKWTGGEGGGW